jgi:hypothetical protein
MSLRHLRSRFGRRAFLRGGLGTAAIALALPTLDVLLNDHGEAFADGGDLPVRFGLWFFGNGVIRDLWKPKAYGNLTETPHLAPLKSVLDNVTVVSNTSTQATQQYTNAHIDTPAAMVTGAPIIKEGFQVSGPSIDRAILPHIANGSPFSSLNVGIATATGGASAIEQHCSHDGPGAPNPGTVDPRIVYQQLFQGTNTDSIVERAVRKKLLDACAKDAVDLQTVLGSNDRARIERHLDGIHEIERQIDALDACELESEIVAPVNDGMVSKDYFASKNNHHLRLLNDIMSKLVVHALACDLTRVVSFQFSSSGSNLTFSELGHSGASYHAMTHDQASGTGYLNEVPAGALFEMECLATLLKGLRDTQEGGASLLDASAWYVTSDTNGRHDISDIPILIAGNARGKINTGRHLDAGGKHPSHVCLALARAVGADLPSFGAQGGYTEEALHGILV